MAHICPPPIVLNARTFDVPLMIFVSGMTFYGKNISYSWSYLYHRFARLVFPVWIFLTIYFTPILCLKFFGIDLGLNFRHVWGSYVLLDGIGYVWIIRVFLLIALITPILLKFNNYIKNQYIFTLIFSLLTGAYLLITYLHIGTNISLINNWIYYAIGYGFLFLLGVRIKGYTKTGIAVFLLTMIFLFIIQSYVDIRRFEWINPIFLHINDFKYPPTNIFLLYGLIMSVVVYAIVYLKKREQLNKFIKFVGCNSIWIYLWHIPIAAITEKIEIMWAVKFIIVYLGALAIYYTQLSVVKMIEKKKEYNILKYLKG